MQNCMSETAKNVSWLFWRFVLAFYFNCTMCWSNTFFISIYCNFANTICANLLWRWQLYDCNVASKV